MISVMVVCPVDDLSGVVCRVYDLSGVVCRVDGLSGVVVIWVVFQLVWTMVSHSGGLSI